MTTLCNFEPFRPALRAALFFRAVLLTIVASVVVVYAAKAISWPRHVVGELSDPRRVPGLSAWCICGMFLAEAAHEWSPTLARLMLSCAWGLATVASAAFLRQSFRGSSIPELLFHPGCFPAMGAPVVVALVGVGAGAPPWARDVGFYQGSIGVFALFPFVLDRLARRDHFVASPSVWILNAPFPFIGNAWSLSDGGARTPRLMGDVLAFGSIVVLGATLCLAVRRHEAIGASFFNPEWASTTFPTCSLAVNGMHLAALRKGWLVTAYGGIMAAAAGLASLGVAVGFAYHLVRGDWLCEHPRWSTRNAVHGTSLTTAAVIHSDSAAVVHADAMQEMEDGSVVARPGGAYAGTATTT